jgi:hypothetical protein
VACAPGGTCAADLPEGLWIREFREASAESVRAGAARFLSQATFGQTTASIDDVVDYFANDPAAWLNEQYALPASRHRDYFRQRAWPALPGTCASTCPAEVQDCEAGTDETYGRRYSYWVSENVRRQSDLRFGHRPENAKGMVFMDRALNADDQLRQRVAWALSHVYITAIGDIGEAADEVEVWLNYYDIFVDNAFGNLRDVLRSVAFSPMMSHYLTYLGSKQYDPVDKFAVDENFAREFMQLFTIGLKEMNADGTYTGAETYDTNDITTQARAWTGFDLPSPRAGIEAKRRELGNGGNFINYVDELRIYPERRDPLP